MLMHIIELYPVNLLQIVFFSLASMGAIFLWKSAVYRTLAFFFLYQSVLMLLNFTEETRLITPFYLITPALTLLVGPLLYFFVRSLVHEVELTARQKWIHLIPMLAVVPFTGYTQSVIALGTVSQLTYLLLSFQLLNRYHIASMAVRSDADSMKLTWIVKALAAFTVLVVIDLVRLNLQTQPHISIDLKMAWYFTDTVLFLCVSAYLLFRAINKPQLFTDMLPYEQSLQDTTSEAEQQDIASAKSLCHSIEAVIVGQALFKQQRLSVNDIAAETGLNVKDISWAINVGSEKNFCEFINSLRVQHMKDTIEGGVPEGTKLLDLAFESGFSSKSTFNTVFKREVGVTPTQFLHKAQRQ